MQIPPLRMSWHAKQRAREFKLPQHEVVAMVHKSTVVYPSRGQFVAKSGDWSIVFSKDGTIITILRNTQDKWSH